MGRVLTVVGAALVLLLAGLALAVYLSRDEDNVAIDNLLAERFSRARFANEMASVIAEAR